MTDGGPPLNPKRSLIWKLVVPAAIFLLFLLFLFIDTNTVLLFTKYDVIKAVLKEDLAKVGNPVENHIRRRPEVAHVDYRRLFQDDKQYMKVLEIAINRPKMIVNANLSMDCDAIKERILPARNPNTGFPILYARLVYKEYEFLEDQLANNYAIENVFCYSIDKKHLPFLANSKYVMANKMVPDFDQAVTSCISELLFNRTRDGLNIDRNFYANISSVRYHHQRNQPGFRIGEFKCET